MEYLLLLDSFSQWWLQSHFLVVPGYSLLLCCCGQTLLLGHCFGVLLIFELAGCCWSVRFVVFGNCFCHSFDSVFWLPLVSWGFSSVNLAMMKPQRCGIGIYSVVEPHCLRRCLMKGYHGCWAGWATELCSGLPTNPLKINYLQDFLPTRHSNWQNCLRSLC